VAGKFYYDRKKKFLSSVWRVRNCYYDRKKRVLVAIVITTGKKTSSRLSGGCRIVIMTGKKVLVAIVITTGKKSSSRLSGGCAIVITTGIKKSSSRDFYAKLNVSNLNVTNLY
jgi:hypothetical protein